MSNPEWTGSVCWMCHGSGRDLYPVTEHVADGVRQVIGHVRTEGPCRACNGHGRNAEAGNR